MSQLHPIRAAIYARVSSERQAEAGTIGSQVDALRARVRQDGLCLEDALCFIDDGYTGTSLVRPALEELRDQAAAGCVDRLCVHSPDRFARRYAYQVLLVNEFQRCGLEVVFLNRPLGGNPEDQLLLQVQGVVAEYERAKLLERCRRGKLHTARQGCVNALAAAPLGYRYIRKADGGGVARFDVVLEEARLVSQIFDWVGRDRATLGEVCRRLQTQGIRTRTGNEKCDRKTILDMLRNPAYKGTAVYGRTRVGPRRPRLRPARGQAEQPRRPSSVYKAERPDVLIAVPALVSEDLFAAVAEQLEENRKRQRQSRRGARWLLQGLLVCQQCGYALYGLGTRQKLANGTMIVHSYYRCIGRNASRFGGHPLCETQQLRVGDLDEAVWQDVCQLLRDPGKIQAEYEHRLNDNPREMPSLVEEQLQRQIKRVQTSLSRLIDAYQEGLLQKEEFEPRVRTARERLARLQSEATVIAEEREQNQCLRLALQGLEEFAGRVQSGLSEAGWHERRDIIRAVVKRVEVGKEEIRVAYRVSPPPFIRAPIGGTFQHCGQGLQASVRKANASWLNPGR
jgi:site-specific DNA recombinase